MNENPTSAAEALELFLERRSRGQGVDPATFAAQHADLGPELISALDALLALERLAPAFGAGGARAEAGATLLARNFPQTP